MTARHMITAAFVNVVAGARLYRPGADEPEVLAARVTVTPPGEFESDDGAQIERLTAAGCLSGPPGAAEAPTRTKGRTRQPVSHGSGEEGSGAQSGGGGADAGSAADKGSGDATNGSPQVAGGDGARPGDGSEPDTGGRGEGDGGAGKAA